MTSSATPASVPIWRWALMGFCMIALLAGFIFAGGWLDPQRLSPRKLVNEIEDNSGHFPGYRRAHSQGICVSGYFESNGQAQALSQAA